MAVSRKQQQLSSEGAGGLVGNLLRSSEAFYCEA